MLKPDTRRFGTTEISASSLSSMMTPRSAMIAAVLWLPAIALASFPFQDPALPWADRIDDLVSRLTLEEKVGQMSHGGAAWNSPTPEIKRLGVKPYQWGTECLSGDVYAGPATSFPMSINMASAFDVNMVQRAARATALEVRAKNNDATKRGIYRFHTGLSCWSPVINIARHPLWGRNQETYGEDPLVNGALAAAFVDGLQGDASERYLLTNAGCKHFAGFAGPLNVNADHAISERDLQTTYLPQFKMCVDAGAWSFMCSYSAINGAPSCGSDRLLTQILRNEWDFPGYVVSDQAALEQIAGTYNTHEPGNQPAGYSPFNTSTATAAALIARAGCDLEDSNWNVSGTGSGSNIFASLTRAVSQGLVTEAELDTNVKRLFGVRFRLGEFDPPHMTRNYTDLPLSVVQSKEHIELASEAARRSMVLLKNARATRDGGDGDGERLALPLSAAQLSGKTIALLGPFADATIAPGKTESTGKCVGKGALYYGDYGAGPFQPYWKQGPGPWADQPTARNLTVTITDALSRRAKAAGARLKVAGGCSNACAFDGKPNVCVASSYDKESVTRAASGADVAVVCLGVSTLVEAEGIDRADISLPGAQDKLLRDTVEAVTASGGTVVVVLFNAGGVDVSFANDENAVGAILAAGYPGQTAGTAVVDTLFGDVAPSGRLAVTWPRSLAQVPGIGNYDMAGSTYRYGQPDPLYPFGYGLSYTSFHYSGLSTSPAAPRTCEIVHVAVTVSNTGVVDADEVILAFAEYSDAPQPTPNRTLVAFSRVHVAAGKDAVVHLEISPARLAVLHVPGMDDAPSTWMADPVKVNLWVGGQQPGMKVKAPSNVLSKTISVTGTPQALSECKRKPRRSR